MSWQTVARIDEVTTGKRKLCDVDGRLAIFRHGDEFIAIDNHCPHRGGPIGAGPLDGDSLTCPWHGLKFDLPSGRCESATHCLVRLPVRVSGDEVQVDLAIPIAAPTENVHRYLIQYGRPGHVGRFGSIERIACARGDRVLVATDRGEEVGIVLVSAQDYDPADQRPPAGELLRVCDDMQILQGDALRAESEHLRERAEVLLTGDVAVLDAEMTFDRETLILYHAGEASAALGPQAARLAAALSVARVQFESLAVDPTRKVASAAPGPKNSSGDPEMRGPYERVKYDFRRVWECPVCHHRAKTPGTITNMFCACQSKEDLIKQLPMKLVDDGPRRSDGKVMPPRKSSIP
jgi:nitrite reductase (NADH) small subunit